MQERSLRERFVLSTTTLLDVKTAFLHLRKKVEQDVEEEWKVTIHRGSGKYNIVILMGKAVAIGFRFMRKDNFEPCFRDVSGDLVLPEFFYKTDPEIWPDEEASSIPFVKEDWKVLVTITAEAKFLNNKMFDRMAGNFCKDLKLVEKNMIPVNKMVTDEEAPLNPMHTFAKMTIGFVPADGTVPIDEVWEE